MTNKLVRLIFKECYITFKCGSPLWDINQSAAHLSGARNVGYTHGTPDSLIETRYHHQPDKIFLQTTQSLAITRKVKKHFIAQIL